MTIAATPYSATTFYHVETGFVFTTLPAGYDPINETMTCPRCGGKGELYQFHHVESGMCFKCRGDGRTVASRTTVAAATAAMTVEIARFEALAAEMVEVEIAGLCDALNAIYAPAPVVEKSAEEISEESASFDALFAEIFGE